MNKLCIFDYNKDCDNCGECNKCDLIPENTCSNCGKCLENKNSDYRQVLIDEINEGDIYDLSEFEELDLQNDEENFDDEVELIDDIDGLVEMIDDPNLDGVEEIFPGFYKLKNSK